MPEVEDKVDSLVTAFQDLSLLIKEQRKQLESMKGAPPGVKNQLGKPLRLIVIESFHFVKNRVTVRILVPISRIGIVDVPSAARSATLKPRA